MWETPCEPSEVNAEVPKTGRDFAYMGYYTVCLLYG